MSWESNGEHFFQPFFNIIFIIFRDFKKNYQALKFAFIARTILRSVQIVCAVTIVWENDIIFIIMGK